MTRSDLLLSRLEFQRHRIARRLRESNPYDQLGESILITTECGSNSECFGTPTTYFT